MTVRSVTRAIDLLEALVSRDGQQSSLTELAEETSIDISTAHRLLTTLRQRGYVRRDSDTKQYAAGPRLALLARRSGQTDLIKQSKPVLEELASISRETANLSVLDVDCAIYVETAPGPLPVRLFTTVGNKVPLYATGAGKALLAWLPQTERAAILETLDLLPRTPTTITDKEILANSLQQIRTQGYAIDNEEFDQGVRCLAVPVGQLDHPIAAISVSGPAERLTLERISQLAPVVKNLADGMARALTDTAAQ